MEELKDLSYKDLQIKAKNLGLAQVIGVSSEELKKYIIDTLSAQNNDSNKGLTGELNDKSSNSNADDSKNTDDVSKVEDENKVTDSLKDPSNKLLEEISVKTNEIKPVILGTDINKDNVAQTRGFRDYSHVKNYIVSDDFRKLSKPDQEELKKWFESI